jgi:hypothetical protein
MIRLTIEEHIIRSRLKSSLRFACSSSRSEAWKVQSALHNASMNSYAHRQQSYYQRTVRVLLLPIIKQCCVSLDAIIPQVMSQAPHAHQQRSQNQATKDAIPHHYTETKSSARIHTRAKQCVMMHYLMSSRSTINAPLPDPRTPIADETSPKTAYYTYPTQEETHTVTTKFKESRAEQRV